MTRRRFEEFVKAVVSALNRSRLSYAVTGAAAASYYGSPRTTADVDFILRISMRSLPKFTAMLRDTGLKFDTAKIRRQLKTGYNIISLPDKTSPYSADFIVQTDRIPRRKGTLLGLPVYYQTPETLILAKLRMIKATLPRDRSIKDKNDIVAILAHTRINMRAIERSARKASTIEIFNEIRPAQSPCTANRPRG